MFVLGCTMQSISVLIMILLVGIGLPLNLILIFAVVLKRRASEPQFFLYCLLSLWNLAEIAVVMVSVLCELLS